MVVCENLYRRPGYNEIGADLTTLYCFNRDWSIVRNLYPWSGYNESGADVTILNPVESVFVVCAKIFGQNGVVAIKLHHKKFTVQFSKLVASHPPTFSSYEVVSCQLRGREIANPRVELLEAEIPRHNLNLVVC